MAGPLVQRAWHRPAWFAIALGLAVGLAIGALTYRSASTSFDNWVARELFRRIDVGARPLLQLSDPYFTVALLACVAICGALARRWDIAVLAVVGPALAIVLVEYVLKPVFGRQLGPYVLYGSTVDALRGSYPSGHETGVVSTALLLLIVSAQVQLSRGWRVVVCVVLALWSVLAAVGLVRNFYHYATDTIGAMGFTVAFMLGTALLVDRSSLSSLGGRSRPSTSRAA